MHSANVVLSVIARALFVLFLLSAGVAVLLLMGYAWSFEIGGILVSGHSPGARRPPSRSRPVSRRTTAFATEV